MIRRYAGRRNRTHGLDKLSGRLRARRSCAAFVEPAAILEPAVGIVTEEVGRTDRPIRPSDCLRLGAGTPLPNPRPRRKEKKR